MILRFTPYTAELRHAFTIATASRTSTPGMLVEVEHDGVIGYGEASMPPYLGESQASAAAFLARIDLGRFPDPFQLGEILPAIDALAPGNTAAKAAVDIALHDWIGKKLGAPWHRIWGLDPTKAPVTSFTIGIDTPEVVRQKTREAAPYKIIKVKLGRDPATDRALIDAIRDVTDRPITVDANQGWSDRADAIEQEACEILGVASLRAYFANPSRFFDDHLKRYSKSRRAAPIYWPLSTPSGSYTLWLYYHRLTDQTLYSCVNDFVEPKLKQVNDTVATLQRRANRSRLEEQELEQQSGFALELAAFRDELLRIARIWQPNLNDGVQITAAPLWRLFQHRAWQKRLKETWEKLEAGDYDWAHLAYTIWPDRVREKCKTDKSLAIAHGLEGLYVEPVKPVKAKKGGGKKQVVMDEDEQGELL